MRTMYDSTNANDIPTTAAIVAGYLAPSSYAWSTADWGRFPTAVHVRIAVSAGTNDGHVLDVEQGDATPAQAPGWVRMRRAAGADPTVYCSEGTWGTVRAAFSAAGVAEPHYWVAAYPGGGPTIPAGAVAHQFADPTTSGGHWDLSAVADYWPGVDGGNMDESTIAKAVWEYGVSTPGWPDPNRVAATGIVVGWTDSRQAELVAKLDALTAALAADTTKVDNDVKAGTTALTAAIHAQPTGGQVDVPTLATALAGPLGAALAPLLPAGVTPATMIAALAAQFTK